MKEEFERSQLLLGKKSLEVLKNSKVAIFGLGGVGSFTAEALARTGVSNIVLVDNDIVSRSNINRQIIALSSTVGKYKVDVMEDRIKDINKDINVETYKLFFLKETEGLDLSDCNYIIDAIDTMSAKISLVEYAKEKNLNLISAMGCGNRLDPTKFKVSDIYKTSNCPLCKVMRYELKKRNIKKLKVVYSTENTCKREELDQEQILNRDKDTKPINGGKKRQTPGSVGFVPSVAGLIIAREVVMSLTEGLRPKSI